MHTVQLGTGMPKEKKMKHEITTRASNIDIPWSSDKKQIREVKLAEKRPKKKKE